MLEGIEACHLKGSSNVMADALSLNLDGKLLKCERDHVFCILKSSRPSGYAPRELFFWYALSVAQACRWSNL